MDKVMFRKMRESSWRELEQFVHFRRQSFKNMKQLTHFIELYQNTANDLSYAQTYFPGDPITRYLNGLVTLAHQRVYRRTQGNQRAVWTFLKDGFPDKVRKYIGYFIVSMFITFSGGVFGFISVLNHPINAYNLLPSGLLDGLQPSAAGPHVINAPVIASSIMTHNMLVTLLCFLGGATLGLYTIFALWQNGMIIGVLAAIFQMDHKSYIFWSLIVPHGVTELTAIFIGGAGGLLFANKLVSPGHLSRLDSLRLCLIDASQLLIGAFFMLVIAGTIEGFITPSNLPAPLKYGIAILTFIVWLLYFSLLGRSKKPHL